MSRCNTGGQGMTLAEEYTGNQGNMWFKMPKGVARDDGIIQKNIKRDLRLFKIDWLYSAGYI